MFISLNWVIISKGFGTPVGQEIDPIWTSDKGDYSTTAEAGALYAPINYGDDWNKTYADTLYTNETDTDTNLTDADILGFGYNHTTDLTSYYNTLYAILGYGDDWNKTYADTLYSNDTNTDTTYTNASFDLSQLAVTGDINMGEHGINNASTNWQPTDEGLVLEMPFNTNTYVNTTLTLDSSGYQNDGTVVGATF